MHEPTDALAAPRFTGIRTFARLPHLPEIDGADAAKADRDVVGHKQAHQLSPRAWDFWSFWLPFW